MRKRLFYFLTLSLLISCKKDSPYTALQVPDKMRTFLQSMLAPADFNDLDLTRFDVTTLDSGKLRLVRIAFTGKSMESDFVLVRSDGSGNCTDGRIVHLDQGPSTGLSFNGALSIRYLNQQLIARSTIENGFVAGSLPAGQGQVTTNSLNAVTVVPASAGAEILPVVMVVGYANSTGATPSQGTYIKLLTLMSMGPDGGGGSSDPGRGSSGGGGAAPGTNTLTTSVSSANIYTALSPSSIPAGSSGTASALKAAATIEIEPDYVTSIPPINISAYFKCFDQLPSTGASYSIMLCTDIPVNTSPDFLTAGNTSGHAFLIVTKTSGAQSITQSFGFYGLNFSATDPFATFIGCIKDNGQREINASISMTLNESQFQILKTEAIKQATNSYALAGYNCTNYALNIFNSLRTSPITIDPLTVYLPSNSSSYNLYPAPNSLSIPFSPQALFVKLRNLKNAGGIESPNITVSQNHSLTAPTSHGECN